MVSYILKLFLLFWYFCEFFVSHIEWPIGSCRQRSELYCSDPCCDRSKGLFFALTVEQRLFWIVIFLCGIPAKYSRFSGDLLTVDVSKVDFYCCGSGLRQESTVFCFHRGAATFLNCGIFLWTTRKYWKFSSDLLTIIIVVSKVD